VSGIVGVGVDGISAILSVLVVAAESVVIACRATRESSPTVALRAKGKALLSLPVFITANAPPDDGASALRRHTIVECGGVVAVVRISADTAIGGPPTLPSTASGELVLLACCR